MTARNLKPWSLRPLGVAVFVLFCAFTVVVLTLVVRALPNLPITVLSKALIMVAALAILGFLFTLAMWHRYWKDVGWEIGFWPFISGPAPSDAHPEAVQAWLWGRRSMHCWFVMAACIVLVPLVENGAVFLGQGSSTLWANHGDVEQRVEADEAEPGWSFAASAYPFGSTRYNWL